MSRPSTCQILQKRTYLDPRDTVEAVSWVHYLRHHDGLLLASV